jgi:hypothetical protein
MARAEIPASLGELRNPQSTQSHVAALKALKHDIIGHEQRKELVIHHGIAPLLVRNLTAEKHGRREEEDEVRVQTVQIVTCLAHGGLAFVQPLLAAGVIRPLLLQLSPTSNAPRLVVESLRAVAALADALATDVLCSPESSGLAQLAGLLFAKPTMDLLVEVLAQRAESFAVDEQIILVLRLICTCLREEKGPHQATLVKAGILDFICCRLASLVESMGCSTQSLDPNFISSMLPAPPRASLHYLLEALACLCHKSAYRSMRIVYSRHLLQVFPIATPQHHTPGDYLSSFSDQSSPFPPSANPIDHFLPKLQAVQSKNEHNFSRAFPALGSFSNNGEGFGGSYYGEGQTIASGRTISALEFGSPLIAWLIHVARHSTGLERLAALELLAKLVSALDQKIMESWAESSRNRERTLAFLVVPLLLRIIEAADPKNASNAGIGGEELRTVRLIRERAPIALAVLISDAEALQKAAYDAGGIPLFSQALKKSFDSVSNARKPMWTSTPHGSAMDTSGAEDDPACSLGAPAMPAEGIHRFRYRTASMLALSAIAAKDDTIRKEVLEMNISSCVVDSLVPYPDGPVSAVQSSSDSTSGKDGNPWFVITGACELVTALSRCIGVLRTRLLDAGLWKPIFGLLTDRDYRLKVAGLDAATNLLLQFSPMRQDMVEQGVIKVICELAHSADTDLRLGALWAIRNLCAQASKEIKLNIVEELGTGWLIQVMSGESSLSPSLRPHMATPNAAGEQVDILNSDEPSMDLDDEEMEPSSEDDEEEDGEARSLLRSFSVPAQHRARLRAIKREEENPTLRARRSDIRIQTKAIDVVRNIICDSGPKQPEVVDTLLQSFGADRLFECLAAKLKPRPTRVGGKSTTSFAPQHHAPAGKRPTLTTPASREDKEANAHAARMASFPTHLYPPEEVLEKTLFTLIHVANGRPAHRHMLLHHSTPLSPQQAPSTLFSSSTYPAKFLPQPPQAKLLDLILPLFFHPEPKIRVACNWMIHNILWVEDQSDGPNARARAQELQRRGFEDAVRSCLNDHDLDVKERAKGNLAMWESGSSTAANVGNTGVSGGRSGIFSSREREREREREMREEVEGRAGGGEHRRGPWP